MVKAVKWLILLLILVLPVSSQAYQLMTYPLFRAFTDAGAMAEGYKLYTYEVGTTTPKEAYSDSTYDTPVANPIVLNSRGESDTKIYMDGEYKLVLKTSADVVVWTVDNYEGEGSTILDFTTLSEYASLSAAVTAIGATEMTLYLDADDTMSGDITIPATLSLVPMRGNIIDVGTHTLTVNGHVSNVPIKWLDLTDSSGAFDYNGPGPINALWAADGDGTDDSVTLQELINAMPTPGGVLEFPYTSSGYGLNTALVLPDPGAGNATTPQNWTIRGSDTVRTKLIALDAINIFETYDVTVVEPANWTFGLIIENLELDGDATGTNGLKLHGIARECYMRNLYIHEFTNAAIYASRWLETIIDNCYAWGNTSDPTQSKYGIYHVDGTTVKVIGGTFNYFEKCYHADGNLTEAASGNDDGPNGLVMIGTVLESCGKAAISIEAGDDFNFTGVHMEDCGDNYASSAYCIYVDNAGGEIPQGIRFTQGTTSVDTTGNEEAFYIAAGRRVVFDGLKDGSVAGGILTSEAQYVRFESGPYANDFRITNVVNLTGYAHDGGNNSATLSDASGDFVNDGVAVGDALYNLTDTSSCIITARDATTITCTLAGGTDNDWDNGDVVAVSESGIADQGATGTTWIEYDQTNYRIARDPGSYMTFDSFGNFRVVKDSGNDDAIGVAVYDGDDDIGATYYIEADGDARLRDSHPQRFYVYEDDTYTISSGAITTTTGLALVDTESAAASDDLDTINNPSDIAQWSVMIVRAYNAGHTVVAKDGTGNLALSGDCTLDSTQDTLHLLWNGTAWQEIACADNN